MAEFECIENVTDLASLARSLAAEPIIAIDTEADSFYHYFDKTCLVQIATPKRISLVDPLALGGPAKLAPLGPVLASKKVRKIFHAGEYDLFVLKRDCGFQFTNLFDTMICAQLLGYPSVGLAALAERHFGVRLPKDEQRSDWSSRPLRESQLAYAAADVTHLIPLTERLEAELRRASRWEWALEEFETLAHRQWPEREFDKLGYLRIKGARALAPEALAILRELYWMRDRRARQVDRPPFKILGNRTLIEIAQQAPESDADLAKIKGMTELMLRRLARDVIGAVSRGKKRKHGPVPRGDGSGRRRMDRPAERRLAALKRWRGERARELALDPGVLCPNSALEAMAVRNPARVEELRDVAGLKGWFVREFGREIVKELASAPAEEPGD